MFADGFSFLEVPRWHLGRLWAADLFAGQVIAVADDGSLDGAVEVPDVPVGLGWTPDGQLLVVTRDRRLLRQEADRLVEVTSSLGDGPAPCNEMTVDGQGRVFIGIFGPASGGLVRVDPDGSAHPVADDLLLPNGQALTADGRSLIVAESAGQRLTAFTIEADGSLTHRREWASFGEPATATALPEVLKQVSMWPDGIAVDAGGAVWVANPFGNEAVRSLKAGRSPTGSPPGTWRSGATGAANHSLAPVPGMSGWATRRLDEAIESREHGSLVGSG